MSEQLDQNGYPIEAPDEGGNFTSEGRVYGLLRNSYIENIFQENRPDPDTFYIPTPEEVLTEINRFGKPIISVHYKNKDNQLAMNFLEAITDDIEDADISSPAIEVTCTVKISMRNELVTTSGETIMIAGLRALIGIIGFMKRSSNDMFEGLGSILSDEELS